MAESSALMPVFTPLPVSFERGDGAWLFDAAGKRYLDCLAGIAVNTLGHRHPALMSALNDQIGKIIHSCNLVEIPLKDKAAQLLVKRAGMTNAFFCNSGLEANEAAIKLARLYGHDKGIDEPHIVVYEKAFHGRSLATLSATGNVKVQKGFEPLVPGFVRLPVNDIEALRKAGDADPRICAVFLEAIQGEGGITEFWIDYLKQVRKLCDERGWLLMIDEVQCGMGRTGKWFAHQWAGIVPDVMPLAKGLGSGVPVGAILAHGEAARTFKAGNHGTTFGGNPLAMRAAITTIETIEKDGLLDNAAKIGEHLKQSFESHLREVPGFVEVRGRGLMIGVVLDRPCGVLVQRALDAGLFLNVTADSVIRLLPPLIFDRSHADHLLDTLLPLIKTFLKEAPANKG